MTPRQEVYDLYWQFAAKRQSIFFKKLGGGVPPYTKDPILQTYKFCNAYRASDRVSQFLIKNVIYGYKTSEADVLFRSLFFRLLNKIETWEALEDRLGKVTLRGFSPRVYSSVLNEISKNDPIYGNAFILCANRAFGFERKHNNHLALLKYIFIESDSHKKILNAKSLQELFLALKCLPLIGDFMAYQIAIDSNYSEVFNFSENDFTIAGPGAIRGIRKCFVNPGSKDFTKIMMLMVENQNREFSRLGIKFKDLWGRPLHAIDCQGLFCEVDKYTRVKFPELKSNRKRIKTKYKQNTKKIEYFYPPKWGINSLIIV